VFSSLTREKRVIRFRLCSTYNMLRKIMSALTSRATVKPAEVLWSLTDNMSLWKYSNVQVLCMRLSWWNWFLNYWPLRPLKAASIRQLRSAMQSQDLGQTDL